MDDKHSRVLAATAHHETTWRQHPRVNLVATRAGEEHFFCLAQPDVCHYLTISHGQGDNMAVEFHLFSAVGGTRRPLLPQAQLCVGLTDAAAYELQEWSLDLVAAAIEFTACAHNAELQLMRRTQRCLQKNQVPPITGTSELEG